MSQITYDFDKLLKQYPGFFKELCAFVDDIRQYDSLKETISALEKRLAAAQKEEEDFKAAMAERKVQVEAEHSAKIQSFNVAIAKREEEMQAQRVTFNQELERSIQVAKDEKDKIVAQATTARVAIEARNADLNAQALALEESIGDAQAELQKLRGEITDARSERNYIQSEIDQLKAKIA